MSLDIAQHTGRLTQAFLAAQFLLALGGMLTFVYAPRSDEPVTLVPLSEEAALTLPQTISSPGSLMLGRGFIEGSYVVRGRRPGFLASLIGDQVLILNASAPGCSPQVKADQP